MAQEALVKAFSQGRKLKEREFQVLMLLLDGLCYKEAMNRIHLSRQSIVCYVMGILKKFGADDMRQVSAMYIRKLETRLGRRPYRYGGAEAPPP
jgi:DNA-binding NarL/FixJ family response regulator